MSCAEQCPELRVLNLKETRSSLPMTLVEDLDDLMLNCPQLALIDFTFSSQTRQGGLRCWHCSSCCAQLLSSHASCSAAASGGSVVQDSAERVQVGA